MQITNGGESASEITPHDGATHKQGSQIQDTIDAIYEKYKNFDEGEVATYIPELGKADPTHFGICLVTVDGHVFRTGDYDKEFTIQSMCKPFAFQILIFNLFECC